MQTQKELIVRSLARLVAAFAAVFYLFLGGWAAFAPASFGANIADYPPYNVHLIHDIGSFMLGLGVAALAGLLASDALVATLAGVAVASVMHTISHVTDRDLATSGHRDMWEVGVVGLLALAGLVAALRQRAGESAPVSAVSAVSAEGSAE